MAVAVAACSSARSSTGSTGSTNPSTNPSTPSNRSSRSTRSPKRAGTATSRPRRQEAAAAGAEAGAARPERRRRPSRWEPTSAPRVGRARACAGAEEVGAAGVAGAGAGAGGRAPVRSCALRASIYRARAHRNCEFYAKRGWRERQLRCFVPVYMGVYMGVKGPGRGHTNSNLPKIKRRPKQTALMFCLSVCYC